MEVKSVIFMLLPKNDPFDFTAIGTKAKKTSDEGGREKVSPKSRRGWHILFVKVQIRHGYRNRSFLWE